jgi:dihydrodipicolinate synthase/N-acetylneuraminate lyase
LIIDLVTPLTSGEGIDGRSLGRHLDRVLPHVQALLISSPHMGEGNRLGLDQREELFEKSLVVVRGKKPILTWISGDTEEETRDILLALKKRKEHRRYSGPLFWVDTPLYYHSNRGLPKHYEELSSLVEESFILYNDPGLINSTYRHFKRNNIRTSILKELALLRNIKGLIFLGSLDRAYNYQKAVRLRTDFRIYDGDESHFLEHPSLNGIVSMGANLAPRAWQKIATSSLNLNGSQGDYPDYLKQVWEAGGYLNKLKDLYEEYGASLLKQVLKNMGVMESVNIETGLKDMERVAREIREVMDRYGDHT